MGATLPLVATGFVVTVAAVAGVIGETALSAIVMLAASGSEIAGATSFRVALESTLRRVMEFATTAATGKDGHGDQGDDRLARQAASALYHLTSAVVMATEAEAA